MVVDPSVVRKAGKLDIASIPSTSITAISKAELARFGPEGLKRIWLDMAYIREFESMLNAFKTQGSWNGIEYKPQGPRPPVHRAGGCLGRTVR